MDRAVFRVREQPGWSLSPGDYRLPFAKFQIPKNRGLAGSTVSAVDWEFGSWASRIERGYSVRSCRSIWYSPIFVQVRLPCLPRIVTFASMNSRFWSILTRESLPVYPSG